VFARDGHTGKEPGIVRFHGGGMVMGSRFAGINQTLAWVERFDAVCVTVDYRLAPEHPTRAPSRTATPRWSGPSSTRPSSGSTRTASSSAGRAPEVV